MDDSATVRARRIDKADRPCSEDTTLNAPPRIFGHQLRDLAKDTDA